MSSPAIENPQPVAGGESKSARKKKAKAEAAAQSSTPAPAVPQEQSKDDSNQGDSNGVYEHPHIKELQKQMRNINKRLQGLQKTDAVIEANKGVSLDELVAQRKLNTDQKAAAEKKPGLLSQHQQLEEQVKTFRAVNDDYQSQLQKQKDDMMSQHKGELEKSKEEARQEAAGTGTGQLKDKLLIFSKFLRAAASKRANEEEAGTDENMAFEGALLLVYGGDQKAVDTAFSIIEGTDEQVPNIEGSLLSVKFSQVKQASIDHAPYQTEEAWANDVAQANATESSIPQGSDPTIANAGLTELDSEKQPNGVSAEVVPESSSAVQGTIGDEAGNLAGDRWDTGAGAQSTAGMDESFEIIPRPNDEVDTPAPAGAATTLAEQEKVGNWADEVAAPQQAATEQAPGNTAGENWDLKPAGDAAQDASFTGGDTAAPAETDDGFQQIAGRQQRGGRGGRGRGDGEFRGRGGRGRGRGGEFRGDRGGGRGRGEFRGGEGRGRGGRGRGGPRGGAEGQAPRGA